MVQYIDHTLYIGAYPVECLIPWVGVALAVAAGLAGTFALVGAVVVQRCRPKPVSYDWE